MAEVKMSLQKGKTNVPLSCCLRSDGNNFTWLSLNLSCLILKQRDWQQTEGHNSCRYHSLKFRRRYKVMLDSLWCHSVWQQQTKRSKRTITILFYQAAQRTSWSLLHDRALVVVNKTNFVRPMKGKENSRERADRYICVVRRSLKHAFVLYYFFTLPLLVREEFSSYRFPKEPGSPWGGGQPAHYTKHMQTTDNCWFLMSGNKELINCWLVI